MIVSLHRRYYISPKDTCKGCTAKPLEWGWRSGMYIFSIYTSIESTVDPKQHTRGLALYQIKTSAQ